MNTCSCQPFCSNHSALRKHGFADNGHEQAINRHSTRPVQTANNEIAGRENPADFYDRASFSRNTSTITTEINTTSDTSQASSDNNSTTTK